MSADGGDRRLALRLALPLAWRFAALAGASAGLAAASLADPIVLPPGWPILAVAGAVALALVRPRRSVGVRVWLVVVAVAAIAAGLALGAERLRAIDGGAFRGAEGRTVTARGFVAAVPRRSRGEVSIRLQTADGRLLVEAREPVPELAVGREVWVAGGLRAPAPWREGYLRRLGIATVLEADRVRLTGRRRDGLAAPLDRIRDRAQAALERGMGPSEAALARGFVLGQDDRIAARTVEDFKRSGLAHLLAVSGQNVLLLALLAMPILGALGLRLRARLAMMLVLIAIYVPVAGAGPSIQRAGVMGAAGIVAALAGRPASRWYAVGLAAFVTLAINPRASGEVGWQLSFVAVIGILLWSGAIRDFVVRRMGPGKEAARGGGWRRPLAEGVALTVAATLATAPLMAHHFEAVPLAALPANVLALPAIAPVMWLGMISAAAGQVPAFPVEVINGLNAVLIGYIAQVARWFAKPDWALVAVPLSTPLALAGSYAAILAAGWLASVTARRREGLGPGRHAGRVAIGLLVALVALALALGGRDGAMAPPDRLEITVLDVGQGDAILLRPPDAEAVLVDAGPPGGRVADRLRAVGLERLAALVITHDQLDHVGGAAEVMGALEVGSLVHAAPAPALLAAARAAGVRPARAVEGGEIRSGELRLEVLWPPRELVEAVDAVPPGAGGGETSLDGDALNRRSLVLLARWRGFSILLSADAEAEAIRLDPGPVDVLKVAHHGSEDRGLPALLDRVGPAIAVVSVGEGNSHSHPADETLAALDERGIRILRTDRDGEIRIVAGPGGWSAGPGAAP